MRNTLLVLLFVTATAARATVVERMSLESLVDRATWIAQARCERTWAAWDARTGAIWTHAELQVLDSLKGGVAGQIIVSEPGGTIGDVGMAVEGVPRYRGGEEVVVFLYRTPAGFLRTRGLGQGKFTVVPDPQGKERRVRLNVAGAALVSPTDAMTRGVTLERLDGMGLEQFVSLIKATVTRRAGQER